MLRMTVLKSATMASVLALGMPALAEPEPYDKPDDAWISISGTVDSISRDSFVLDYGDGIVTVEMDDGDRDADAYKLLKGDEVTVAGLVDKGMFEDTTIEAGSVYVENIGTHFFASAADEEQLRSLVVTVPVEVSQSVLRGTITEIADDGFTLNTGEQKLHVDVDEMPYNPLDDKGYQQLEKGDFVEVAGRVDRELFDGRVFDAESVVVIVDN